MSDKKPPQRAYRLTLKLDADDAAAMCNALQNLGLEILRGKISTGCWGGCDNGAIYELLTDPAMTHDEYHRQLREYLDAKESQG